MQKRQPWRDLDAIRIGTQFRRRIEGNRFSFAEDGCLVEKRMRGLLVPRSGFRQSILRIVAVFLIGFVHTTKR